MRADAQVSQADTGAAAEAAAQPDAAAAAEAAAAAAEAAAAAAAEAAEAAYWESLYDENPEQIGANGVNTLREARIIGLNPGNPSAFFKVSNARNVISWSSVSGRVYSVYRTTNLSEGFQPLETNIQWTVESFTDTNPPASGQIFYKLGVRLHDDFDDDDGGYDDDFDDDDGYVDDGEDHATEV